MTNIAEQQNVPERIRLLVAQAQLYTEAKRIRLVRLGISTLLAAVAPLVAVFVPQAQPLMAGVGFLWLAITYTKPPHGVGE